MARRSGLWRRSWMTGTHPVVRQLGGPAGRRSASRRSVSRRLGESASVVGASVSRRLGESCSPADLLWQRSRATMSFDTTGRARRRAMVEGGQMQDKLLAVAARLSDADLLRRVVVLATREREATVELVAHLAELDARRLYAGEGFGSLFSYCTGALRLSEHAAYNRIEAARASRRRSCHPRPAGRRVPEPQHGAAARPAPPSRQLRVARVDRRRGGASGRSRCSSHGWPRGPTWRPRCAGSLPRCSRPRRHHRCRRQGCHQRRSRPGCDRRCHLRKRNPRC